MNKNDRAGFFRLLIASGEVYGRTYSAQAQLLYWEALELYELSHVETAFKRHMQDTDVGQYPPKPADIIRQLRLVYNDGVPDPDEAWAKAIAACIFDQSRTVVIETAIFTAFPFALWPDDKIGARMAFKAAYPRELRKHGGAMFVSLGFDPELRRQVIVDAVEAGLLPAESGVTQVLEAPELSASPGPQSLVKMSASASHELARQRNKG